MHSVYIDSSVFLAILAGEESAHGVRELFRELKKEKIRIVTSIITIQEVSVSCYRRGKPAHDYHTVVGKIARIQSITKDMALTAAKYEATLLDKFSGTQADKEAENKRRKWDCFHMACAVILECETLYSNDPGMLKRKKQFGIPKIQFLEPKPKRPLLQLEAVPKFSAADGDANGNQEISEQPSSEQASLDAVAPSVSGSRERSLEDQAGTKGGAPREGAISQGRAPHEEHA